ncbi:MAG TPA: serine/threonine-protein kinase [Pseudonocardiaceae bacterium]|nr:serine/threonine-protein kinase [Pseudonocardiaceae bacterium]
MAVRLVKPLHDDDPRRVGPFEILNRLGEGGCGVVYLGVARDSGLVAVKVMRAALERGEKRDEHRARFRREIEFLTYFSHRFVPRFVKSGNHQGCPYLATQFVAGPTLHALVWQCGRLPVEAVLGLGAGLAGIVHDMHRLGVHRDVKPGNVLVTPEGPHLIDFGLAHLRDAVHVTRQGDIVGTREYLDPDGGMPADVFGLGGTLLYAATGHPPYEAATPGSADRPPTGPVDFSGVPEELREILESCLHPTRSQRPRAVTILELLQARRRVTSFAATLPATVARELRDTAAPFTSIPAPVPFRAHPAPPRAPRPDQPRPNQPRPDQPRPDERRAVPASAGGRDAVPGWRRQLGDWVQAVVAAPASQVLVVTADGVITALAESDGVQRWQEKLPAATTGALAITGSRVYVGADDGDLHVLDVRDGRRLPRSRVGGRVSSCVLAGRYVVAVASDGAVAAFDGATGAHAWDDTLGCALTGGLAVAGPMVYAGGADGRVYAIDTSRDGEISHFPSMGQRIHAVAVSGVGVHVAGADGGVISLGLNGSAPGWRLGADHGQVWACRADPASTLVATASIEGVLRVDDAATGSNRLTRSDLRAIRRSLTLHGATLLVGCVDGPLIAMDVRSGAELRRLDGDSPMDAPAAVTSSGVIVGGWLDGTVIGLALSPGYSLAWI